MTGFSHVPIGSSAGVAAERDVTPDPARPESSTPCGVRRRAQRDRQSGRHLGQVGQAPVQPVKDITGPVKRPIRLLRSALNIVAAQQGLWYVVWVPVVLCLSWAFHCFRR
jgi:hypothetical protein